MNTPDTTYKFSGLIDTRNASHIERDAQTRKVISVEHYPNVDMLYGVYDSKEEAWNALSSKNSDGQDALVVGRTVGIKQDNKTIEYWFESACSSIDDLVEKHATIVSIDLLPEGDDYTKVEGIRMYNAVKNAPLNAVFIGIADGMKFTLQCYLTSAGVVITYIDGDTRQRIDIDGDSYKVTLSYVEFA